MNILKEKAATLKEEQLFTLGMVFVGSSIVESILPYPLDSLLFPLLATGLYFQSGHQIPILENGYNASKTLLLSKYSQWKEKKREIQVINEESEDKSDDEEDFENSECSDDDDETFWIWIKRIILLL